MAGGRAFLTVDSRGFSTLSGADPHSQEHKECYRRVSDSSLLRSNDGREIWQQT